MFEIDPGLRPEPEDPLLQLRLDVIGQEVIPAVLARSQDLNEWQIEAISDRVLSKEQTYDLPTRTGKSHLIRELAAECYNFGMRPLIVSHRSHILDEHTTELRSKGVPVYDIQFGEGALPHGVLIGSVQSIALNRERDDSTAKNIDVVFVDEGHRALGAKTVEGMRRLFPDAIFMAFTATPDYAENRSVTDVYGEKAISKSIVEAIETGMVSPVRAFLYKTQGQIDFLDPARAEFTPRELRRLADFVTRNKAIVDIAQDLVSQGRQGLITTIPGDNLLHAETLLKQLESRKVPSIDGGSRPLRARVIHGEDRDKRAVLQAFEDGAIDVLLYCDTIREGYTTAKASFLINGRPTTSMVNLTQDAGRVLQRKDLDAIIIDFMDRSIKQQVTIYDVLELNRSVQGIYVGTSRATSRGGSKPHDENEFMHGLFRSELVDRFQEYNYELIADLRYKPEPTDPLERYRQEERRKQAITTHKLRRQWDKILAKEGFEPDQPDLFGASVKSMENRRTVTKAGTGYVRDFYNEHFRGSSTWGLLRDRYAILPVIPVAPRDLAKINPAVIGPQVPSAEDLALSNVNILRGVLAAAFRGLTEPEQRILSLRFGLKSDDRQPKTLDEIAAIVGLTRERIRQIESRATSKLRHPYESSELRHMLDGNNWRDADDLVPIDQSPSPELNKPLSSGLDSSVKTEAKSQPPVEASTISANNHAMRQRDDYFTYINLIVGKGYERAQEADRLVRRVKDALELSFGDYDFVAKQKLAERMAFVRVLDGQTELRGLAAMVEKLVEILWWRKNDINGMNRAEYSQHLASLIATSLRQHDDTIATD